MACFIVPMALGILTTLLHRKFPKELHAGWLNALLWGGTLMLAVEHVAHGEIVPYPPFLTAGLAEVLPEMLTIGAPMAIVNVGIWSAMILVNRKIARAAIPRNLTEKTGIARR